MRAAWLVVLFAGLHLAGFRDYSSMLSGTSPDGGLIDAGAIIRGGLYVISWLSVVLAVPIFIIGAGIMAALLRLVRR